MKKFDPKYFESMRSVSEQSMFGKSLSTIKGFFVSLFSKQIESYQKIYFSYYWAPFSSCKTVLDIGCGTGLFLSGRPDTIKAIGTETSETVVKELKKQGFDTIKADCRKLPFKNNSIDGIHFSHVIEHLEDPHEAIEEFKRVLRPGGVLVIKTPNFARSISSFYDDYTHKSPFTKTGLYRLLNDNGFKNIQVINDLYSPQLMQLLTPIPELRFFTERNLSYFSKNLITICER